MNGSGFLNVERVRWPVNTDPPSGSRPLCALSRRSSCGSSCGLSPKTGLGGAGAEQPRRPARGGWAVNDKRIRRLWRDEGLRVPQRSRKKRLTGTGTHVGAMSPIRPNVLWALDFQFDVTDDGRTIKMLNIIDEYTRECLAIKVARTIDADDVVDVLDRLAAVHGAPAFVRFDNGGEFIAAAVADWCRFNGVDTIFIDPGSPWQNAWIESFNGKFRDELLNGWQFDSLLEAQVLVEDFRIDYNMNRPHTAHGDLTPTEFAQQCKADNQQKVA